MRPCNIRMGFQTYLECFTGTRRKPNRSLFQIYEVVSGMLRFLVLVTSLSAVFLLLSTTRTHNTGDVSESKDESSKFIAHLFAPRSGLLGHPAPMRSLNSLPPRPVFVRSLNSHEDHIPLQMLSQLNRHQSSDSGLCSSFH